MKKKLFLGLFVIIDVLAILVCINLSIIYNNDKSMLLDKLADENYDDLLEKLELERDSIIDEIELMIDYEFENEKSFNDIIDKLNEDYNTLIATNNELVKKKGNLNFQQGSLTKVYNNLVEEERKKSTFIIENFPLINQYSLGYPTGCESAALTNLLNYWGVPVSMGEVVNNVKKGSLPYYENEVRYGGNPYIEFIGHPNNYYSYGVYEKPMIDVANQFKLGIIDGTGMSLSNVLEVVKEGRPVMVWVSMNMAIPYIGDSWIYKPTLEKINWMSNEHALVVIGYNSNQVIVSDSLNGKVRYYDKTVFESRYNTYGKRAIYY